MHRVTKTIVSDCNVKLLSYFCKTLCAKLEIKLLFSSDYHPQTDGKTEVTNRTLSTLLHVLTKKTSRGQKNACHSRVHQQSSMTLYNQHIPLRCGLWLQPIVAIGHPPATTTRGSKRGREHIGATYLKKVHEDTRHTTERQVQRLATKLNTNKHPMVFNPGDLVWLHLRNDYFPTELKSKILGASTLQRQHLQGRPHATSTM